MHKIYEHNQNFSAPVDVPLERELQIKPLKNVSFQMEKKLINSIFQNRLLSAHVYDKSLVTNQIGKNKF